MKLDNSKKIINLEKHLDKTKALLTSIPERRLSQKETYLKWVKLEIKRTEKKIEQLKA